MILRTPIAAMSLMAATPAIAQVNHQDHATHSMDQPPEQHEELGEHGHDGGGHVHHRPDAHAPIGVLADHAHAKGEVMLAYRFMHMAMAGSQTGTNAISPDEIATTVPNRFAGNPGQPPTLRVVPLEMSMDMHMFGAMFAPVDWVTLMAMGSYVSGEMGHQTYLGATGEEVLGQFETQAEGFGDPSLSGLFPVSLGDNADLTLRAGISIPAGSTSETEVVLTPMNERMPARLPYAMQIGSGTWDVLAGATVMGNDGAFGWGGQVSSVIRTGRNEQGYRLGNKHEATAWASYTLAPWMSTSVRLTGETTGRIKGIDSRIVAPVQTADPDNYGKHQASVFLGVNLLAVEGALEGYRIGMEVGLPFYQDLNGTQLKDDWSLMLGAQKAF